MYPNSSENIYSTQYPNTRPLLNLPQEKFQQAWQNYGEPAADFLKNQVVQRGLMGFAPIIPAGAISYALNNPQGKIAAFGATTFGAPIVAGIKNFANKPLIQKADKNFGKFLDFLF